ncbi:MAG: Mn2+/Fe2+ NRAMP family transporter [Vicingaceae bacterium]
MTKAFLARLGPGLLYAGAAVGVSHLVQSTRAGANYGLLMILVVVAANIIKYPFFKAGPLYAAQTGKSLLEAFHETGKWAMGLFYLVTVGTMFAVQAAVTLITASVVASIFGLTFPLWQISGAILLVCFLILLIGKYQLLNSIMKTVIILLTITTLITLVAAFSNPPEQIAETFNFSFSNNLDVLFLIALIGWMPAPLDISLWHSEWTLADSKELNVKKSISDFEVGYWGTTFLAISFVALGSIMLRGSGEELSSSGVLFAGQVIGMYTKTLGDWSFLIVSIAAFTTMFSTTLTVLDAFPRVLEKAVRLSFSTTQSEFKNLYTWILLLVISGALLILIYLLDNMKQLIDFATSISFVTAPILASLIYYVVQKSKIRLFSNLEKYIAWFGLIFLYAFSSYYIWIKWM